jgi:hypothetical protein
MNKMISMGLITLASLALGLAQTARADDGEGLAMPRKGTPEYAAYVAADAQYQKDDGNPSYHLQAIKLVDGDGIEGQASLEVDFNSAEDGEYDYTVQIVKQNGKWVATHVTNISGNGSSN